MTGPIRGARLAAEVKLQIVWAVAEATDQGFAANKACEVIMIDPRRLRRWVAGRKVDELKAQDLADRPPVARTSPHALTLDEMATSGPAPTSCAIQCAIQTYSLPKCGLSLKQRQILPIGTHTTTGTGDISCQGSIAGLQPHAHGSAESR